MKLTKILGLVAFMLFSGVLLRGQGWIKEYQSPTGKLVSTGSVASKNNGFASVGYVFTSNTTLPALAIIKADSNGTLIWQKFFNDILIQYSSLKAGSGVDSLNIIQSNDDGYIISISHQSPLNSIILKIDELGNQVWLKQFIIGNAGQPVQIIANKEKTNYCLYDGRKLLRVNNSGTLIREDNVVISKKVYITKLIPAAANSSSDFIGIGQTDLNTIPTTIAGTSFFEIFANDSFKIIEPSRGIVQSGYDLFGLTDGSFIIITKKNSTTQLVKVSADYKLQWSNNISITDSYIRITATPDNGFITSGNSEYNSSSLIQKITRHNKNGDIIWQKQPLKNSGSDFNHSIFKVDGDSYIIGYAINSTHIKISGDGSIYSTKLSGNVINDQNNNCKPDPIEPIFKGQSIVSAYKNATNETFYGSTDSLGKYTLEVDTGNYVVKVLTPNYPYWTNCTPSVSKAFLTVGTKDTLNFALKPNINCPAMVVDISTPFVRRCFQNTYFLRYCNQGTTAAQNARIEVKLDSLLEYVSATRPLSNRTGQTLIFNLGNVAALDCGSFSITTRTRCGDSTRLGQTLCSEAKIYPDTICNSPANWSGANVVVNGRCDRDSVRFTIRNTSSVPTASLKSIIVEDEIVFFRENRSILPNSFRTIAFPANGKTWRINQDQEPNNPRNVVVTAVVEGCRIGNGVFSTGFVNDFPNSTGDPSVSVSCMPIVGSFDPNEKLAFPEGFKNEHFIEQNTAIDYQIGFQNTGTDTAFTIVVRDTLSDALDISSLKLGASSHNYTWELTSKNVLSFTFDDIKLVDSFKNEAASHGFVKFRINQIKDVKLGTRIENKAAIFFDFNAPIFTNKTFHNVGMNLLRVSVESVLEEKTKVKVYPNPFSDVAIFELDPSVSKGIFELFDLTGKVLRRETFASPIFEFHKKDLPTGVYIFKITNNEGQIVGKGKVFAR